MEARILHLYSKFFQLNLWFLFTAFLSFSPFLVLVKILISKVRSCPVQWFLRTRFVVWWISPVQSLGASRWVFDRFWFGSISLRFFILFWCSLVLVLCSCVFHIEPRPAVALQPYCLGAVGADSEWDLTMGQAATSAPCFLSLIFLPFAWSFCVTSAEALPAVSRPCFSPPVLVCSSCADPRPCLPLFSVRVHCRGRSAPSSRCSAPTLSEHQSVLAGMKTVRILLQAFRFVRIWIRIFNIWYCILIRIFKLYIYDVDI